MATSLYWRSNRSVSTHCARSIAALLAGCCGLSQPIFAADTSTDSVGPANDLALAEVTVTGTRIAREGFTAPTPTTTMDRVDFEARAATTVSSILFDMPAVRPNNGGASSPANTGSSFINLRNLGNNRTLVLVDGRRFVATSIDGVVDANIIPAALVERVEVVTGGASAAWGSDAVSGVVNFIFKKKLDGFEGSLQYGQTQRSDNRERAASLAWGTGFANDRGQIMIATEYSSNYDRQKFSDREWSNRHTAFVTGTLNGAAISNIRTDGATFIGTNGGAITNATVAGRSTVVTPSSPLGGIQFVGPNGSVAPYVNGAFFTGGNFQVGGSGGWYLDKFAFSPPVDRNSIYTRATFDFSDRVQGFAEVTHARSATAHYEPFLLVSPSGRGTISIQRDNAYIPTQVRNILTANPTISNFTLARINNELGAPNYDVTNKTLRWVAGLQGSFASTGQWNVYYTHGSTDYIQNYNNSLNVLNWTAALDAVVVNNSIVCRASTVASLGAAPGCVPANPFGEGTVSDAVRNYVIGNQRFQATIEQDAAGAQVQGEPFATWAGKVSLTGGVEWRKESVVGDADALSQRVSSIGLGAFSAGNQQPIAGSYNVKELFAETIVPLLAKLPGAEALDLNAAIRSTDYSTSGKVTSSKIGGTYRPISTLMLRATQSEDIRAPNLNELFQSGAFVGATILDFGQLVNGQPSNYNVFLQTKGNLALQPEKAKTKTVGITWQPEWVPGLRASVDYYSVDISGAIGAVTAQQTISGCYGAQGFAVTPAFCSFLTRDPATGRITNITSANQNFQSVTTRGIDYELGYRFGLNRLWNRLGGDLSLRLLATNVKSMIINTGTSAIDRVGEVGNGVTVGTSNPDWRGALTATYSYGPLVAFAQMRYIGPGVVNAGFVTGKDINDNHIPSSTVFDASLQYALIQTDHSRFQVFGKVSNLFDRAPPVFPNTLLTQPPTNFSLYDTAGRAFTIGLRFER